MATEKTNEPKMVDIHIPRGNANDDPNLFVGINGVNYLLPKGKTSKVPDFVAEEINRAIHAQELADEHADELRNQAPSEQ